jgi:hypothetical protein
MGLRDIFSHAWRASPRSGQPAADELSPFESLFLRSQAVDYARQHMPGWLGGYGKARMADFDNLRGESPRMREKTVRAGEYPDGVPTDGGIAAEAARRVAQAAGVAAADATSQGAQNIWWFVNAAQAAAQAAGQQAMHGRLRGLEGAPPDKPFTRQHYAVSAAFPLVLGASAAVGNLFRQPGYTAVLPGDEDRRESSNPLMEQGLRALGMTGRLLPYDEFVQERPDVSRGEYEAYKAYLYGSPMPVKFNPDGIHGAEVSLLGKSIPILTGLAPLAGGVVGGAVGLRMAGKRLAAKQTRPDGSIKANQFQTLQNRQLDVDRLRQALGAENLSPDDYARLTGELRQAELRQAKQLNKVEDALLGGALAGSSIGLGVTGAGAMLLEQVRRAANAADNRRRQQEELGTASTAPRNQSA